MYFRFLRGKIVSKKILTIRLRRFDTERSYAERIIRRREWEGGEEETIGGKRGADPIVESKDFPNYYNPLMR